MVRDVQNKKVSQRVKNYGQQIYNFHLGVSFLTQPFASGTLQSEHVIENQMLRAEFSMWSQKYAHLENEIKVIKEKLISMERDKNASNSTTQSDHEYDPE